MQEIEVPFKSGVCEIWQTSLLYEFCNPDCSYQGCLTDICSWFFSVQRHAFLYHEGAARKVFPCTICKKEFSRPDKMKQHLKQAHEGGGGGGASGAKDKSIKAESGAASSGGPPSDLVAALPPPPPPPLVIDPSSAAVAVTTASMAAASMTEAANAASVAAAARAAVAAMAASAMSGVDTKTSTVS